MSKNDWDLDTTRLLFRCLSLSFLGGAPIYALILWLLGTKEITISHIYAVSLLLFTSIAFALIWGILGVKRSNNENNIKG